jgi:alanine racemase
VSDFPSAQINLTALRQNHQIVKQYAPNSRVMSVVKADAYGHGMVRVAKALDHSDAFAVARLSEGVQLRQQGIKQPIVILEGVNTLEAFDSAAEFELSPVIHHQDQIELLSKTRLAKPVQFVWMMVDSGMHRLGIAAAEAFEAWQMLSQLENIQGPVGLMSHFANADEIGDARNDAQLNIMHTLAEQTGAETCLANSAAILSLPASHGDWVRPGLMLYGISPFETQSGAEFGLAPVMRLSTQIVGLCEIDQGEQVGYGGIWTAQQATRVGIASIGYGDGYLRHLSNQADVSVQGQRVPVIGRVSMDTICLDLTAIAEASIGAEVVLWGDGGLAVEEVAVWANTIAYELVTTLTSRVLKVTVDG